MVDDKGDAQFELIPALAQARARTAAATERTTAKDRAASTFEPAPGLPVARVRVDVPLAHLDRPFDYAVPAAMADAAVPGARVKVRFAGQGVDGFVVARVATTSCATSGSRNAASRRRVIVATSSAVSGRIRRPGTVRCGPRPSPP